MLPINTHMQNRHQLVTEIGRLADAGNMDMAQFICAKFVAQFPGDAMAAILMARILFHKGQMVQAVKYIEIAASLLNGKSTWGEVLSASTTLQMLGEDELSRRVLDLLDIESPENKQALHDIASQFSAVGDHDESLRWFEFALSLGQDGFSVNQLRGKVLAYTGPLDDAARALENAIEFKPDSGSTHWSIAVLDLPNGRERRVARMENAFQAGGMERLDEQFLGYALFREYDRLNDVENAWRHLDRAAELRRSDVDYSAVRENELFDQLISASHFLQVVEDVDAKKSDSAVPIFIVGMPRTGTTLLERMLGNYDELQPCGELTVIRNQLQMLANRVFLNPFDSLFVSSLPTIDLPILGQNYLEKTRWRRQGKAFFTDKLPLNFNFAGIITMALPQARIINLMRNPMDTCFSNLKEFFGPLHYTYSYRQDELANHYKNYRKLMAHWHYVAPGRILDVRYENLVMHPEMEAERVRLFCGLPKMDQMSDISKNMHVTTTASTVQVREPVHKRNIEAWKKYEKYLGELKNLLEVEQRQYQEDIQSLPL